MEVLRIVKFSFNDSLKWWVNENNVVYDCEIQINTLQILNKDNKHTPQLSVGCKYTFTLSHIKTVHEAMKCTIVFVQFMPFLTTAERGKNSEDWRAAGDNAMRLSVRGFIPPLTPSCTGSEASLTACSRILFRYTLQSEGGFQLGFVS